MATKRRAATERLLSVYRAVAERLPSGYRGPLPRALVSGSGQGKLFAPRPPNALVRRSCGGGAAPGRRGHVAHGARGAFSGATMLWPPSSDIVGRRRLIRRGYVGDVTLYLETPTAQKMFYRGCPRPEGDLLAHLGTPGAGASVCSSGSDGFRSRADRRGSCGWRRGVGAQSGAPGREANQARAAIEQPSQRGSRREGVLGRRPQFRAASLHRRGVEGLKDISPPCDTQTHTAELLSSM